MRKWQSNSPAEPCTIERAEQIKTWSFFDGGGALPDVAISALNKRN